MKTDVLESTTESARKVTRYIQADVKCILWGRSAGRCQFSGCNKPLWKSGVTQDSVNMAEKAHIYSFSNQGPRGHEEILEDQLNQIGNLMLVCHDCHKVIDRKHGKYPVDLLQGMKRAHERRVELACAIHQDMSSHILVYGANIGQHSSSLVPENLASAIFPARYPASEHPIELSMRNSALRDDGEVYWLAEVAQLKSTFKSLVKSGLDIGKIKHLSVFALAPQPLLILLGSLLTEITACDVYQRHKEPAPSWTWPDAGVAVIPFKTTRGDNPEGVPCLVFALSGTVRPARVREAVPDASVWTVEIEPPNPGFVKSREQQQLFRDTVRAVLDQIKAVHGQTTQIHIFPAAPQSLMVEFGRVRMPKADAPWRIYDQINERSGFVHALDIGQERQ